MAEASSLFLGLSLDKMILERLVLGPLRGFLHHQDL